MIKDSTGEIKDSRIIVTDLLKTLMSTDLDMGTDRIIGLDETYLPINYSEAVSWEVVARSTQQT